jgi:hypothetical protein
LFLNSKESKPDNFPLLFWCHFKPKPKCQLKCKEDSLWLPNTSTISILNSKLSMRGALTNSKKWIRLESKTLSMLAVLKVGMTQATMPSPKLSNSILLKRAKLSFSKLASSLRKTIIIQNGKLATVGSMLKLDLPLILQTLLLYTTSNLLSKWTQLSMTLRAPSLPSRGLKREPLSMLVSLPALLFSLTPCSSGLPLLLSRTMCKGELLYQRTKP